MAVTLDIPAIDGSEFPHEYSGKMLKTTFVKGFTFTHRDHVREIFPAGSYEVPEEVATHWFAQAHTENPPEGQPVPGTPAYTERARKELLATNQRAFLAQQQTMTASTAAQKKIMEDAIRIEVETKIRAEMKAEADAKAKAAVPAPTAPAPVVAKA